MYKCEICGKEYESLKDRANCEWNCSKKLEFEDEQRKREVLKKEKKVRADEVNKAYNDYQKLYDEYYEEYRDSSFIPKDTLNLFFGF